MQKIQIEAIDAGGTFAGRLRLVRVQPNRSFQADAEWNEVCRKNKRTLPLVALPQTHMASVSKY